MDTVVVERECGETADWLPANMVREQIAELTLVILQLADSPNLSINQREVINRGARQLNDARAASFDAAISYPCRFEGSVEVEVHERHVEVWLCPQCHTLHQSEQPEDDDEMWRD